MKGDISEVIGKHSVINLDVLDDFTDGRTARLTYSVIFTYINNDRLNILP